MDLNYISLRQNKRRGGFIHTFRNGRISLSGEEMEKYLEEKYKWRRA